MENIIVVAAVVIAVVYLFKRYRKKVGFNSQGCSGGCAGCCASGAGKSIPKGNRGNHNAGGAPENGNIIPLASKKGRF